MSEAGLRSFLDGYGVAFSGDAVDDLLTKFAFPLHLLGEADEVAPVSIARAEDWRPILERLLEGYRSLGVAEAEPLQLWTATLTGRVGIARAHWELRREDGSAIYDFNAVYTLARLADGWGIVAIAHDETPRLLAALRA